MTAADQAAAQALAPSGTLRAAINFGNGVLAQRDKATGAPGGVSVELAHELARRLAVPLQLVPFEQAGQVVDALKHDAWDIAFLAIDPKRGQEILFTPAYVHIEGAYIVRQDSTRHSPAEVDQPGVRVAVARDSAYDLFLTRTLKQAAIERFAGASEAYDLLEAGGIDAAGGVRSVLARYIEAHPALRLVSPSFMVIEQAMGTRVGRDAGRDYLVTFIEEMKANGFVADALKRTGQRDAAVAPPAAAPHHFNQGKA